MHRLKFWRNPIFSNDYFLWFVGFVLALFISIKYVFFDVSNNYSIFYYSLQHLISGENLYTEYPNLYFDHYHYAPTFAALFSPVFLLPYKVGLFIWSFLFTAVWIYAIYQLPYEKRIKVFIFWYAVQELLTSIDNSQTNPLIAAIPLLAYTLFEKKQVFWAAALIAIGFNIKIYSLATAGLFLLYPQKLKFIGSLIFWMIALALLPLIFTTPEKLYWQYELWVNQLLIKSDHDKWLNQSIHRLVHLSISPAISNATIIGVGVVLFCTIYLQIKKFTEQHFKSLVVASILIFHVIFNPAAESATFIIAITGVAIWWHFSPKETIDWILLIGCYFLTTLSPTDFVPKTIQKNVIEPYVLKALPCVLIWFRILYTIHFKKAAIIK